MAFTTATIIHTYQNGDGTPCSGEVIFSLLAPMTNGNVSIMPSHVTTTVQDDGTISQVLASNLDAATVPGVYWRVDEKIQGAPLRTYEIQVPSGGVGNVDLGALMPFQSSQEAG